MGIALTKNRNLRAPRWIIGATVAAVGLLGALIVPMTAATAAGDDTFTVSATASDTVATPAVPYSYTVSWANNSPASVGTGSFVDVLPYNGDSRGTTGLTGFAAIAVTASDPTVTVLYTSDPVASVNAALAIDPSGNTGINWSEQMGAVVNAVQLNTEELQAGSSGSAQISLTPYALVRLGVIGNDVQGMVSGSATPIQTAKTTLTSTTAEMSGNVYKDNDRSFSKTSGDTNLAGAKVQITGGYSFGPNGVDDGGAGDDVAVSAGRLQSATCDANGNYFFPGLPTGKYTFTIASSVATAGTVLAVSPSLTTPFTVPRLAVLTNQDLAVQPPAPVQPAPVAADLVLTVDSTVPGLVSAFAYAQIYGTTVISALGSAAHGVVTLAGSTGISYASDPGYVGMDSFTYTITDTLGQSSTATVTVTVNPLPLANPDAYSLLADTSFTAPVMSNDTGFGLSLNSIVTPPSHGAATMGAGNTVVYTPEPGFVGTDTLVYEIIDAAQQVSSATVTFTVVPGAAANDDAYTIPQNAAFSAPVLSNDLGDQIEVDAITAAPSNGTATFSASGITYTPKAGFSGTDTLVYEIRDSQGEKSTATVTFTVQVAPAATNFSVNVAADGTISIPVLDHATGTSISIDAGSSPTAGQGVVTINSDGTMTYTSTGASSSVDSFVYTVIDDLGQKSSAVVTVNVFAMPTSTTLDVKVSAGKSVTTAAIVGTNWPSGAGVATTPTAQGTASFDATAGNVAYMASASTGTDREVLTYTDPVGQVGTVTIDYTIVDAVHAADMSATTTAGNAITVDPLAGSTGDAISIDSATSPLSGSTAIVDGKIVYTPEGDFAGVVTFEYTIIDSFGYPSTGTITISVYGAPVPVNLASQTDFQTPVTVNTWSFTPSGQEANYMWSATTVSVADGAHGKVVLNNDGTMTYTPEDGFSGTDVVTYTVKDDGGQEAAATWTITVGEAAPPAPTADPSGTPAPPDPQPSVPSADPTTAILVPTASATPSTPSEFHLPFTGADTTLWLIAGISLVAMGLIFLILRRRRRDEDADASSQA